MDGIFTLARRMVTLALHCSHGRHRAAEPGRRNDGYYFSHCLGCRCDLVRAAHGRWRRPKGYRVVWIPRSQKDAAPRRPEAPKTAQPAASPRPCDRAYNGSAIERNALTDPPSAIEQTSFAAEADPALQEAPPVACTGPETNVPEAEEQQIDVVVEVHSDAMARGPEEAAYPSRGLSSCAAPSPIASSGPASSEEMVHPENEAEPAYREFMDADDRSDDFAWDEFIEPEAPAPRLAIEEPAQPVDLPPDFHAQLGPAKKKGGKNNVRT